MAQTDRARRKREAILEAASALFLERGYAAVSIDDVLAAVGGSKATVYRYFGSKDGLFEAVVLRLCESCLTPIVSLELKALPLRAALVKLGVTVLNVLADPLALEAYRLAISEAPRHPRAARAYFKAAPETAARALAAYLAERQALGEVREGDPLRLASLFLDSLSHHLLMRALLGLAPIQPRDEHDPFVNEAVEVFLGGVTPV